MNASCTVLGYGNYTIHANADQKNVDMFVLMTCWILIGASRRDLSATLSFYSTVIFILDNAARGAKDHIPATLPELFFANFAMFFSLSKKEILRCSAAATGGSARRVLRPSSDPAIRTHMNHGGSFMGAPPTQHGPRRPLQLGLDVTKASQNVLRLLEATHGINNYSAQFQDTSDPCWHPSGTRLGLTVNGKWKRLDHEPANGRLEWIPTISWMQFSDDRTAMAKVQAMDGSHRFLSLLRLDQVGHTASSIVANDGWVILRELVSSSADDLAPSADDMISLVHCLEGYLNIEHGGGEADYDRASELFAPEASLLTVGIAPTGQEPSEWSAPAGTFLEISRDAYLQGVKNQTPHNHHCRHHDAIVQVDLAPGGAAAATVKVGNGAQTMVFVDHLLLGKEDDGWKILSKTFSPHL
jgi:Putative lumazine-binding